jgi:hypothetical protein
MKVIVLVGVLTALIVAPSAGAAKDPRVAPLQAKVNVLTSTVSALQGSVTELQRALVAVNDKDTCSTALTFDVLGLIVQYITGSAQSRLDDGGACARLGISRGTVYKLTTGMAPDAHSELRAVYRAGLGLTR